MSETVQAETAPELEAEQEDATTNEQPENEEFDKARAMHTIKTLREIEKQGKRDAKELATYKAAEEERQKSEMSEIDRLKAEKDEIEAKYEATRKENLQRQTAADVGLPEEFALRIQGSSAEEMKADAEEMLKAIPKKAAAHVGTTNPGAGNLAGETDEQKRMRLFGPSKMGV